MQASHLGSMRAIKMVSKKSICDNRARERDMHSEIENRRVEEGRGIISCRA